MENIKKKQRPYNEYERQLLLQLVQSKIDVIGNRKTDGVTQRKKTEAWEEITLQFNNSNVSQTADTKQLKKMLQNLKTKARDAKTLEAQKKNTGAPAPDMEPSESQVIAVMPNVLPFIKVEIDSDSSIASGPAVSLDNEEHWSPKRPRVSDMQQREYENETETNQQPRCTSAFTEQSSGTGEIVPSNNNVLEGRKTNKSLDELKQDLLLQELEHNKKKFELEMKINEAKYKQEMEFLKRKHTLELQILEIRKEKLLKNKTIDEYYLY